MITGAILSLIYFLLVGLIFLLPSGTILPDGVETAVAFMGSALAGLINFIPALSPVPVIIGLIIIFEVGYFAWRSFNWVMNIVRGSGN